MKISKIIENVNRVVGKGSYSYGELVGYLDEAIDTINVDLNVYIPLISEVYENDFDKSEAELLLLEEDPTLYLDPDHVDYDGGSHAFLRIPAAYIRNYMCYEAAYRILRDEDEDDEVVAPKKYHAVDWYRRLVAVFNDYTLDDTEAISIGGDADEVLGETSVDDTGVGFYNPIDPIDNQ